MWYVVWLHKNASGVKSFIFSSRVAYLDGIYNFSILLFEEGYLQLLQGCFCITFAFALTRMIMYDQVLGFSEYIEEVYAAYE